MINKEITVQNNDQIKDILWINAKMSVIRKLSFIFCYFVLLSFLCISCGMDDSDSSDLQKYYFPLENMRAAKNYIYTSSGNDSLDKQIWNLKAEIKEDKTFMIGTMSQSDGRITQQWKEERTNSGMVMDRYSLAMNDTVGEAFANASVMNDDVFPFKADKGGIFLFNLKWTDPADDKIGYELIRNRIYVGDTLMTIMNKKVKAVHFKIKERVEVNTEGILGIDLSGDEYYGEDLGLVQYVKNIGGQRSITYTLTQIKDTRM